LEGKKYDKLWLRTEYLTLKKPYSDGTTPVSLALEIEGKSTDGYSWFFYVPDSIHNISTVNYMIKTQPFDFENKKEGFISFTIPGSDHIISGIDFNKRFVKIEGVYRKTIEESFEYDDNIAYILTDTSVLAPKFEHDIFYINLTDSTLNIGVFLNFPDFKKIPENNYLEELQKRVNYVTKHSNSKSLFEDFFFSEGYKSKTDMKLVFDNFSDSLKNTLDGKQMMEYLIKIIRPAALDTTRLINTGTKQSELIIENPSKYTLVIFSASWCGPCHKQIPLLKEIYRDLGTKLNIVYISIDHKNDIDSWNKLIERENIPWRSLFADEKYEGLKEKYAIKGIPHSILVSPDGKEEEIDVRISSDKEKLYNLTEAIK
jgi:thiol-disulfide isomerase/thioredoxin